MSRELTGEKYLLKQIDYIVYILMLFYCLADCFSGGAMHGLPSISVPYKMLLLFLMMINVKSYYGITIYTYLFSLILLCVLHYSFSNYSDFSTSLAMLLRIVMFPLLFIYINSTFKNDKEKIYKIAKFNLITLSLNFG